MKDGRKIGPLLATLPVAGNMIGSGIFLLPATLAAVGLRVMVRSHTQLLALAAIVVFLTGPVYPFVIQHARRPPALPQY
jgi:amino acid permease